VFTSAHWRPHPEPDEFSLLPPLPICLRYIRMSASHPNKKPCPPCPLSTPQPSNILWVQTMKHVSSSLDIRDEVSHLYKTFHIVVSYTLVSVSWTADWMTKYSGVAAEIPLWILSHSVDKCNIYLALHFPNISQDLLPMFMIMVNRHSFLFCTHALHISRK